MTRIITASFLLCATALFTCSVALAGPITVPAGLHQGDQYRLVFVTSSSRDATSSNIADYNSFASAVAVSVPALAALGTTWTAIVSTATVAAEDNTMTNPTNDHSYPIYDLAGNLVASSSQALWGTGFTTPSLAKPISVTESGSQLFTDVWTGSNPDGTPDSGLTMGHVPGLARAGITLFSNLGWITNQEVPSTDAFPLYAMSDVLTAVPEPSSIILASLAAVGVSIFANRKRRYARQANADPMTRSFRRGYLLHTASNTALRN